MEVYEKSLEVERSTELEFLSKTVYGLDRNGQRRMGRVQ